MEKYNFFIKKVKKRKKEELWMKREKSAQGHKAQGNIGTQGIRVQDEIATASCFLAKARQRPRNDESRITPDESGLRTANSRRVKNLELLRLRSV